MEIRIIITMGECVVCFEKCEKFAIYHPCKHEKICLKCTLTLRFKIPVGEKYIKCPLCNGQVVSIGNWNSWDISKALTTTVISEQLHSAYLAYIKICITPYTASDLGCNDKDDQVCNEILKIFLDVVKANETPIIEPYPRMTPEHSNNLLQEISTKYPHLVDSKLTHMFVALCSLPWLCSARFTSSGVCYHGLFGDVTGYSLAAYVGCLVENNAILLTAHRQCM